ncbi:MAG: hypothetical protein NC320_00910 [Clostridium sp.]|nr:hypothetical protein [Clostridium sp.]
MIDWNTQRDVMSNPFNITVHKRTFKNYLEIILDENGNAYYAVPSHQTWLIQKACETLNVNQEELMKLTPREYYCDMLTWLTKITDCVAVWDMAYIGTLNKNQKSQLELLTLENLYKGSI